MPKLIEELREKGVLHSFALARALKEVDRAHFVPEEQRPLAHEDVALPVGSGQTISQPYTVVFMLEQLRVRPGDHVLEVGYGSGWQTALLAKLVEPSGKVCAFEIVPKLCEVGRENFERYPYLAPRVTFYCQNARSGCPEDAPFDRIISAAEVREVPKAWRKQLATGGRMMYPQGGALVLEVKKENGSFASSIFPGFVFVPFIEG